MTVARRLLSLADSLSAAGIPAVAAGDFNDVPSSEPCRMLEPSLVNLAGPLARRGLGTIRFDGRWELIDMFMVSPDLAPDASMEIVRLPFLTVRDGTHSGEKPLRTYSGPRYVGGVSDHRPVLLRLQVPW